MNSGVGASIVGEATQSTSSNSRAIAVTVTVTVTVLRVKMLQPYHQYLPLSFQKIRPSR